MTEVRHVVRRRPAHVHRHARLPCAARSRPSRAPRCRRCGARARRLIAATGAGRGYRRPDLRLRSAPSACESPQLLLTARGGRRPTPRCPRRDRSRRGPRRVWASPPRRCRWPIGSPGRRERVRRRSRHRLECGRELRLLRRDDDVDVVDPPPALRDPRRRRRAAARASRRRGRLSSVAGNSVPRSGSPVGPSSASATACAIASPSECPARRGASSMRTPPSTSGGASPNGWTSNPSPTRCLIRARPGRRASACASSRSPATVILRLRGSPGTTTTVPPCASTSAASSVSTAPHLRARRAASRRGRPAGSAPRPDPSRGTVSSDAVAVDALHRVGDRQRRDRAVGSGAHGRDHGREQRPRRERPGRVVHDDDLASSGRRARARRAPSPTGSHRPAPRATPVGRRPTRRPAGPRRRPSVTRGPRRSDGAVEHRRATERGELLRGAEARTTSRRQRRWPSSTRPQRIARPDPE